MSTRTMPKPRPNPTTLTSDELHEIVSTIQNTLLPNVDAFYLEELVNTLLDEFGKHGEETLRSILQFEYEKTMKKVHQECIKRADELYERYLSSDCTKPPYKMVLMPIAKELKLAPALLARIIVDKHYEINPIEEDEEVTKEDIAEMMKFPELFPDARLSLEVDDCLMNDDFYGPEPDAVKQAMGDEFELYLRQTGTAMGIKFIQEEGSRGVGFDKTPDLKLQSPIYVDGSIIHWIESKALFGSEELHNSYVIEQYERYCKRFGPGLVIYWFGFVNNIHYTTDANSIIISEDFPADAISLVKPKKNNHQTKSVYPTGESVDRWHNVFDRVIP